MLFRDDIQLLLKISSLALFLTLSNYQLIISSVLLAHPLPHVKTIIFALVVEEIDP